MTGSTKQDDSLKKPFLLGVAGGSGSGKTYFSAALKVALGSHLCEIVYQDNFYIDQSHRFDFDGGSVNFDHPDSIDFQLLTECLRNLKSGQTTEIPVYDFATHKRGKHTLVVEPKPVIIVDGILILHSASVRDLFDHKIFFAADESLRFARRLARDVQERGRSPDGVKIQFAKQVKPMHDQFVEPSRSHADFVVSDETRFQEILDSYHRNLLARKL